MDKPRHGRTMSQTDITSSSAIRDAIDRDLTIPADRRQHRFFLQLSRHDFILPSLTRFDQDFRKFLLSELVDFQLIRELEEAKCVNWCPILPKFLALQTSGDGNCLMHSVSLCMWAVQDRRLTLRKSVYQVLIEDQTDMFRRRWQFEHEKHLEEQNGSPVDCSNEQWDKDWKKTVELAKTSKSPETCSFEALEEIHIFALANILRRPILVICDDIHRGNYDELVGDVNLGGIYLPLLCDSVECVKSPIVIGYHHGHFTALVTTEDGSTTGEDILGQKRNKNAIPLMKYDDAPMKLHFLLPDEQASPDRLLREYLNCSKIEYTNHGVTRTILVAIMQSQEPEAHLDQMFRTYFEALQDIYLEKLSERQLTLSGQQNIPRQGSHSTVLAAQHTTRCCSGHKRCKNTVCRNYTSQSNDYCHECRKPRPQLCTSPGCTFAANPGYEGLCSTCFARYRAILEEGATMTIPSAPPKNECSNSNCHKKAGTHFHGKCQECYLTSFGNAATTSTPTLIAKEENIATPYQNNFGMVGSSLPRQNSRIFCFNQMCNNRLSNSELIYCERCSNEQRRHDMFYNGNNERQAVICSIPGCSLLAETYHKQLCREHYEQSLSHNQSKPNRQTMNQQTTTKCVTLGCNFFGIQDHNFLCSRCHAKAMQAEYDMQRMQSRAQEQFIASQVAERNPEQCYFNYQRRPFYHEINSSPSKSASAPPSPQRKRTIMNTVPCTTKGCPRLGTEKKQGLCDVCFGKKEELLHEGSSRRERHSSLP